MLSYTVLNGPVDHDGARYEDGAEILRLSAQEAAALVALGVVGATPEGGKKGKPAEPGD
jgi:hypothetical protein